MNTEKTDLEKDILFRYYEDQWKHVRHHEVLRSNLTLQVVISAGALVVAYTGADINNTLKGVISIIIIALGLIGVIATRTIKKTNDNHIHRARAARKSLQFLELHTSSSNGFASITTLYVGINSLISIFGIALCIITFCKCVMPV